MMYLFTLALTATALTQSLVFGNPMPTPAPELQVLEKRACAADNCLRGFRNRIVTAVPFCETYTATLTATIPTWAAAACATNPTRVSSACSCLQVCFSSCLVMQTSDMTQTSTLTQVYGPTDNTNYTIFSQAENIRSDPGPAPDEYFNNCYNMCMGESKRHPPC
jgi:hypothetical protein